MHYYKRHLGDYAKDTRHLSMAEHGAYCLLLDYYYATEKPIPDARCERIANAYADEEKKAVRQVLSEFFKETKDGWRNLKADQVIAASHDKSLKAKEAAEARWHSERNADAMRTHSERNAIHKPLSISKKKIQKESGADAPQSAEAMLTAYRTNLPNCQSVHVLNPKRRKRFAAAEKLARQVCKSQGWEYVPEQFWSAYFGQCAKDPWMRGEVANPNNANWRQNIDVLLAEDRFASIMDIAIAAMKEEA